MENKILTNEDLISLSTEELTYLYKHYSARALIQKNIEQAIKILINSLYGYLGSPYSRFYNMYIAEAITLTGQAIIRTSANLINNDLEKITGSKKDRIPGIDTDSVPFDTILNINNEEILIGVYYASIPDTNLVDSSKSIKKVTNGDVSLSFDGTDIESKPITYVMRHKVKKQLYRVSVGNDYVDVTQDHSVMVINELGNMITIKPNDLDNTKHKVVSLTNTFLKPNITNNFTVECLGEIDDYVYDIEVEDNHNFFANNILVHNSNYIDLTDIVNSEKTGWYKKTDDEIVTLLDKFCNTRLDKVITDGFDELFNKLNAFDPCIYMKREAIGSGVFVQKKRYTMYVYDNEGVRYPKPKLKIIGLEAVRSSTPKYFREKLKTVYELMYTADQPTIHKAVENIRKEFLQLPIMEIGKPSGVNGLGEYDNHSKELGNFAKGTPAGPKAAFTYNRLIEQYGLTDKHHLINSGDKIKTFNVKLPNPYKNDKVAILDKVPEEFDLEKYVDREGMFEDSFLSPITAVLNARNWHASKQVNLDDIFG